MSLFGKIDGKVYGDFVYLDKSHNLALVEALLADQAKKTLDSLNSIERRITIFKAKYKGKKIMGWRTGTDKELDIVGEHYV
jgi:hypothetical protein